MELGDPFLLRNAVDLIGSNTQAVVLHERDVPTGFWSGVKAFEREFYVGRPIEAARLVTRRLFELVGGYDEEISSGADFDLHDRYGAATQIVACDDGLILHHTGHSTLRSLLRKKYSYGRAAQGYLTKATSRSIPTLLNVQMRAFFARPRDAATHPAKYGALWLLRALEACALFAGLIRSAISSSQSMGFERPATIELLLVSPTTVYGSWGWFAELLDSSPAEWSWTVVTYGRPAQSTQRNVRFLGPRRGNYIKFGRFLWKHSYLSLLNPLWYVPLVPYLVWVRLRRRPALVIGNGILASAIAEFLFRGRSVVLVHHVYLGYISGIARMAAARAIRKSSLVLANSEGGADDIRAISNGVVRDLVVVPMWASDEFFQVPLQAPNDDKPVVTYVGRCDPDKSSQVFRVGGDLAVKGKIQLNVVGDGELLASLPEHSNIRRYGYISDRRELARLLSVSDLVWAPADTTYLSRPGWEGLASGARLVITDHPPAAEKIASEIRIQQALIPLRYGKVVSGDDDLDVNRYLCSEAAWHRTLDERQACRAFAQEKAGAQNREIAITALAKALSA
jgi:glycosyltransferase involved in cell wall biosynthesis